MEDRGVGVPPEVAVVEVVVWGVVICSAVEVGGTAEVGVRGGVVLVAVAVGGESVAVAILLLVGMNERRMKLLCVLVGL